MPPSSPDVADIFPLGIIVGEHATGTLRARYWYATGLLLVCYWYWYAICY